MEKTIFEALGGSYTEVGEVLIPDLELSSADAACLGKYGQMRKPYLKEPPILQESSKQKKRNESCLI